MPNASTVTRQKSNQSNQLRSKSPFFYGPSLAVLTPRYWKKYPKHHSPASRTRGIMALLEDSGFQFRMGNKTLTVCFMFFFFVRAVISKRKELQIHFGGFFIPPLWFWGFERVLNSSSFRIGTYIIRPLALPISRGRYNGSNNCLPVFSSLWGWSGGLPSSSSFTTKNCK